MTATSASVTAILSQRLRLLRRPLRTFSVSVPISFGDHEPGEILWSHHTLLPFVPGPATAQAESGLPEYQVPLMLLTVSEQEEPPSLTLELLDLREALASFWSPLQVLAVGDADSGLARVDLGGGWTTERAQEAYVLRPGEDVHGRVEAGEPLLGEGGLTIHGGGDTQRILNSYLSEGAGDTFTSWTKTTTGTPGQLVASGLRYWLHGSGRAAFLSVLAVTDVTTLSQTVAGYLAGDYVTARVWYQNQEGTDPMGVKIQRSSDSKYWNDATPAWQVGSVVNAMPFTADDRIAQWTSARIPAEGTTSITVTVGYHGAQAVAVNDGHVVAIELLDADETVWGRRGGLPAIASATTRVADLTSIDGAVWSLTRGHCLLDFTPLWSHADLADGDVKVILSRSPSTGADDGTMQRHELRYERVSSTAGVWRFVAVDGASVETAAELATSGATLPAAGTSYHLALRWTSESHDEFGTPGQSKALWVDGVRGTDHEGAATPSFAGGRLHLYSRQDTAARATDGRLRNLTVVDWCPPDGWMERV